LQTTYEAAANLAKWDRKSLEREHDPRRVARLPRDTSGRALH